MTRLPAVRKNHKRAYVRCKQCNETYWYDYVPYSLSNPIMCLPCCHGIGVPWVNRVTYIKRNEFYASKRELK